MVNSIIGTELEKMEFRNERVLCLGIGATATGVPSCANHALTTKIVTLQLNAYLSLRWWEHLTSSLIQWMATRPIHSRLTGPS